MIDEWFDRSYQEGRAEFHAGIGHMLSGLARVVGFYRHRERRPKLSSQPQEGFPCDPGY
jgi:hypothetical protein